MLEFISYMCPAMNYHTGSWYPISIHLLSGKTKVLTTLLTHIIVREEMARFPSMVDTHSLSLSLSLSLSNTHTHSLSLTHQNKHTSIKVI